MTHGTQNEIADVERCVVTVESVLIVLSIAAADRFVAPSASRGFLYLIPMSYNALTHRWPVFASLLTVCVVLRVWDTPFDQQSWGRLAVGWRRSHAPT